MCYLFKNNVLYITYYIDKEKWYLMNGVNSDDVIKENVKNLKIMKDFQDSNTFRKKQRKVQTKQEKQINKIIIRKRMYN